MNRERFMAMLCFSGVGFSVVVGPNNATLLHLKDKHSNDLIEFEFDQFGAFEAVRIVRDESKRAPQ